MTTTIEQLQTLEGAETFVKDLSEVCRKNLIEALSKTLTSKESLEQLPALEEENFRIDSTNRKEITDPNGVKVKENPEWDVREYLEGKYKWEQLFTQKSALRETRKVGKKLPESWTVYENILMKKYGWNYQDFVTWENMLFVGWRGSVTEEFRFVNEEFGLRCFGGSYFHGNRYNWCNCRNTEGYGCSVRCVKSVG